MSTGRRAYDLLRGYVNREWDRIRGVEMDAAETELQEALDDPRLMRPRSEPQPVQATPTPDNQVLARQILGVSSKANFAEVRHAFDRLNKRSAAVNFPPGSPEALQASEIQKRVHWAYAVLSDGVDATEKRFRSLEID